MKTIVEWWSDPLTGMHIPALDWFLFFGFFVASLAIWGIILADIRESI